jgi:hypothetical protein
LIPWRVIVACEGNLDALSAFDHPALVRLEAPGRDFEVTKRLLQAGAEEIPEETGTDWACLPYRKGQFLRPGLLYRGFCRVLRGLRQSFGARPHLHILSCPEAIAELLDKNTTGRRLRAAGLPCPPTLDAPESPEELLQEVGRRGWPTAYVKLATGSATTGSAVLHALDQPPWAVTSVLCRAGGSREKRELRHSAGDDLDQVLRLLLREGVCVQRGISMAQIDGQNFDVRVIVIQGQVAFTIFRLSSQPMTNLRLGGRHGQAEYCRASIPTQPWLDGLDHCLQAARLYPCAVVGVDLLFERGYWRHYLLEMSAFGDYYPGLTDERGRTVYQAEIEATARQVGLF